MSAIFVVYYSAKEGEKKLHTSPALYFGAP
jgi:hypothetical protein